MRIAVIATFRHPTRLLLKERTIMQSAAPELVAGLCPDHAEIELYNEKEVDVPLDRHWDLVFFSYMHPFYEHTKVLSMLFRQKGMVTVAGGRHASHNVADCLEHFDVVVSGEPEPNVPALVSDFEAAVFRESTRARGTVRKRAAPATTSSTSPRTGFAFRESRPPAAARSVATSAS